MLRKRDVPTFEIQRKFPDGTIPEEPRLPLVKRYECVYCDAVFGLKLFLNRHYGEKHGKAIPDLAEYLRSCSVPIVTRELIQGLEIENQTANH